MTSKSPSRKTKEFARKKKWVANSEINNANLYTSHDQKSKSKFWKRKEKF